MACSGGHPACDGEGSNCGATDAALRHDSARIRQAMHLSWPVPRSSTVMPWRRGQGVRVTHLR